MSFSNDFQNAKTPTSQELEEGTRKLYHHVNCKQLEGLRIQLTDKGQEYKKYYSIIGLSSKETIKTGLKAVDESPFKTIFVVEEVSGKVLFALSKNEDYVKGAKKKKPKSTPNPPPPVSFCCQVCQFKGGYACDPLSDGSCICYQDERQSGGNVNVDQPLGTLSL